MLRGSGDESPATILLRPEAVPDHASLVALNLWRVRINPPALICAGPRDSTCSRWSIHLLADVSTAVEHDKGTPDDVPPILGVDEAGHRHSDSVGRSGAERPRQQRRFKVGGRLLLKIDDVDASVRHQVLRASESHDVARLAKRLPEPIKPCVVGCHIERETRLKEDLTREDVRGDVQVLGDPAELADPAPADCRDMQELQVVARAAGPEDVAKAQAIRVQMLADGATDVAVDGGRRRHPKRRLPPDQEMRIAKRRGWSLGLDANGMHGV